MTKALTAIYALLASINPFIASVFLVTVTAGTIITYMHSLWASLLTRIGAMTAVTIGSASFTPLGLIDCFVPINILLDAVTAYLGLLLVCSAIRVIKSFIPLIST